ncbi:MAG: site-specific integrase [Candidatus Thiodiazotropha sp. (ex Dulcina madagascariensis)]|nr:site-specific integrase [Candidatus Thiodiazotropha sp. (ex Dulcina madagascariensis)]
MDALRLLFCHLLKIPWAGSFDWDYWSAGAQVLGNGHPTVARSCKMIGQAVENTKNSLGTQFTGLYRKFLVAIRIPDYSINTEKSYFGWTNRFLRFHHDKLPGDCSEPDVASFLEHLALQRKVAGPTQAQALNVLVFFFSRVLQRPLGEIGPFKRPKKPRRLPTVLSPREIELVLVKSNPDISTQIRIQFLLFATLHSRSNKQVLID